MWHLCYENYVVGASEQPVVDTELAALFSVFCYGVTKGKLIKMYNVCGA